MLSENPDLIKILQDALTATNGLVITDQTSNAVDHIYDQSIRIILLDPKNQTNTKEKLFHDLKEKYPSLLQLHTDGNKNNTVFLIGPKKGFICCELPHPASMWLVDQVLKEASDYHTIIFGKELSKIPSNEKKPVSATEAALNIALTKLNAVFQNAPDAILITSLRTGKIIEANEAIRELIGMNQSDVIGKSIHELLTPLDSHGNRKNMEALQNGEKIKNVEAAFRKNTGEEIHVLLSGEVFELNHEPVVITTIHDISGMVQAKEILKISEARFQQVTEISEAAVWEIDANGRYTYLSNKNTLLIGYAHDDLIGRTFYDLFPEEHKEALMAKMTDVFEQKQVFKNLEYPVIGKDKRTYFLETSAFPIIDRDGNFQGYRGVGFNITKRKMAELKLQENEEYFRAIFENNATAIALIDPDTTINMVNDAYCKISGYTKEEVVGMSWTQQLPPDELVRLQEYSRLRNQDHKAAPSKYEYKFYTKQGEIKHAFMSVSLIERTQQRICSFIDVTDRVRAEQELMRSKELANRQYYALKSIDDSIGSPIFSLDRYYRYSSFNEKHQAMMNALYGTRIEIGTSILDAITVTIDREKAKNNIDKALKGEYVVEDSFSGDDQLKRIYFEVTHGPIFDENENIVGVSVLALDLTSRLEIEHALRESTEYLENLINYANAPIIVWNPNYTIARFNPAFQNLTGYAESEVIGKKLALLFPEDTKTESLREIEKAIGGKHWDSVEIPILCKNQESRIVLWNSATVYAQDNKTVISTIAQGVDITERKKAENELKSINEELKKTNFELDKFVYSTSHDLRSPLTSILGILNFIDKGTKEPTTKIHAQLIRSGINRLDDFIKNLLNYSRNSRMEITPVSIDFKAISTQTIHGLQNMEQAEKMHFDIQINDALPFYSDLQRVITIFENLIANAIKYSNPNETDPFVKIKVDGDAREARITIEDNGIGISAEHQQKVFDMFYRISGNTQGSGLGLYLVKEIIEKLKGTIHLESELSKGSKFLITLPNLDYGKHI